MHYKDTAFSPKILKKDLKSSLVWQIYLIDFSKVKHFFKRQN